MRRSEFNRVRGSGLSIRGNPSPVARCSLRSRATLSPTRGKGKKEMTAPDLPAELKAALDARLHGLSRNDAAERAAIISKTYRDGGGSGAIKSETDALAYALARMPATYAAVDRKPERAARDHGPISRRKTCSMSGPDRARRAGPRPKHFCRCKALIWSMPTAALRALALDLASGSARLRGMTYARGEARAGAGRCRGGRPRGGELRGRRTRRCRANRARRSDVGENPRHAVDRRTRNAGRLSEDSRAAGAIDRGGRACRSPLPA